MLEMQQATSCVWMLDLSIICCQSVNGICLISTLFSMKIFAFILLNIRKRLLGGVDHTKESTGAERCLIDQAFGLDFS